MADGPLPRFELGVPGPMRDKLTGSVLTGEKTATSSLLMEYEDAGEPLPRAGTIAVMVDSRERAIAKVEITAVELIRLGDADLQLALDEGEGFQSVADWRSAHEAFWERESRPALHDPASLRLDDETVVVVERFRLLDAVLPQ